MRYGDDDGDIDRVARALSVLRVTAVPALLRPFTQTFGWLDLGAIEAGVYAFEIGDPGFASLVSTTQPVEELERMLASDGFEATGDGRWRFGEDSSADDRDVPGLQDRPTGGFPAVAVQPGLLVMASSPEALDGIDAADGAGDAVRAVVEGAGSSWGVAVFAADPTVVGDTTRYVPTPRSDGPAEQIVFNTLLDTSPFASC